MPQFDWLEPRRAWTQDGQLIEYRLESSFDPVLYLALLIRLRPSQIRLLLYGAGVDSHYRIVEIPKSSGGVRLLLIPDQDLARVQKAINKRLLASLKPHPASHAYHEGRSIFTNVVPHQGASYLFSLDLADAFHSVTETRLVGVLIGMVIGVDLKIGWYLARLIAKLCTAMVPKVGVPCLPQGAPTSPDLFNLFCKNLDRRLSNYAAKIGAIYTRYSDNLSISHWRELTKVERRVICKIVLKAGFEINAAKTRYTKRSGHSNLTFPGLVMRGSQTSLSKSRQRQLRAAIYNARKHDEEERLEGLLGYAYQVYGAKIPIQILGK